MIEFANPYEIYGNKLGISPNTHYIGDYIPDIECMLIADKKGYPADAIKEIKVVTDFVFSKNDIEVAVREFAKWMCVEK